MMKEEQHMSMIKADHLSFAYPGSCDLIFNDVSFQLDTNWKLGFIGRNGRGKTTFLNLLLGNYEYTGTITHSVEFDYFPYPVADKSRQTGDILREISPDAEDWEFSRELSCLNVDEEVLQRPFETLSNGERTKVLLAALFLNEGHFLLIDEPTNHLDLQGRALVSAYLARKKGFILVSHDRDFLDGCVDHILSLNRADIQVRAGNFSSWMENFQRQQSFEEAQNQRLKKDVKRLKQAARRTQQWSNKIEASKQGAYDKGFVGHKSAKMMKRSKSIEARQTAAIEEAESLLQNAETADRLKLSPLQYHAETLVRYRDAAACYDGRPVCPPVTFEIRRGERIALDGPNGSGKSSLMKLLLDASLDHTGTVTVGSGLVVSHVPQNTDHLQGSLTEFVRAHKLEEALFKAILRKMDFARAQFEKDLSDYSAGQKKKVLLAKSLCEQAHLYIWDEPLNYIDVYSRMQIETLIQEFAPTMLFVEHDKAFREAVATKVVSL